MNGIRSATGQNTCKPNKLPWRSGEPPLMLAPMQGLTNRAIRAMFIDWVRPDVVFTEFMRVSNVSRKRLMRNDLTEAGSATGGVPLVAQLVGNDVQALVTAARNAETAGARHINLNMGCPYGRMTTSATGGAMLQHPAQLSTIIPALRQAIGKRLLGAELNQFPDRLGAVFLLPAQVVHQRLVKVCPGERERMGHVLGEFTGLPAPGQRLVRIAQQPQHQ